MDTLKRYERDAYGALNAAEETGATPPPVVSVFAQIGGELVDALILRSALMSARRAIIAEGGVYRAAFI